MTEKLARKSVQTYGRTKRSLLPTLSLSLSLSLFLSPFPLLGEAEVFRPAQCRRRRRRNHAASRGSRRPVRWAQLSSALLYAKKIAALPPRIESDWSGVELRPPAPANPPAYQPDLPFQPPTTPRRKMQSRKNMSIDATLPLPVFLFHLDSAEPSRPWFSTVRYHPPLYPTHR